MIADEIASGESKILEFKESIPKKNQIAQTICAFANRAGGKLLIGVSDCGAIIGLSNEQIEDYMERLPNIIHDSISPMIMPEFYTYRLEDKGLIVIEVFSGNRTPYFIKSSGKDHGTYIRIGRTNKLADAELIRSLERKGQHIRFDQELYKETNVQTIEQLTRILTKELNQDIGFLELKTLGLVKQVGSVDYLTNAGAIILGDMDHGIIRCARFVGDSSITFLDKKEYAGSLFDQIEGATHFIISHLNVSGVFEEGNLRRKDELELPINIAREAIVTAVLHRDYSMSGSDIKVAIYNSQIDIVSPGGLTGTITIDEIYAGRSEIRNTTLAKVLLKANLIEQWGSGIPRIRETCRLKGYELPIVSEDGMFVKLTIFRKTMYYGTHVKETSEQYNNTENSKHFQKDFVRTRREGMDNNSEEAQHFQKNLRKPDEYVWAKSRKATKEITDQLLEIIKKHDDITVKELAEMSGIPRSTVQRRLADLQKQEKLVRTGSKKTGLWLVK